MRRFVVPGVITLVVVALLALLAFGVSRSGPGNSLAAKVHRGEQPLAPNADMALQLLGSPQKETLDKLHGRVVMVNVFAGWCVACQDEVSVLKHAQQMLTQHGGAMVGVTFQDSTSDAASYMRKYGLHYSVLLDPAGSFVAPYGVTGVPETFVIGRDGHVVAADTAQMTQRWADQALNHALGGAA